MPPSFGQIAGEIKQTRWIFQTHFGRRRRRRIDIYHHFLGVGIFIIILPCHRILISLSSQSWWSLIIILSMHHLRNVLSWTGGGLNLSEARQSKWQGHLHARAAVNMKVSVTCCWNWLLQQVLWTFYDCWCESNCCHLILFLDTHCQSYTSLLPTCFLLDL